MIVSPLAQEVNRALFFKNGHFVALWGSHYEMKYVRGFLISWGVHLLCPFRQGQCEPPVALSRLDHQSCALRDNTHNTDSPANRRFDEALPLVQGVLWPAGFAVVVCRQGNLRQQNG